MSLITSCVHKDTIDRLCKNIKCKTGFDYFVMYMVFNNGQRFVLSNMYPLLEEYYHEGYYREDYSCNPNIISRVDHYLCGETPSVSDRLRVYLEDKVNIHRTYYTVRSCPEVQLVFGAAKNIASDNPALLYEKTVKDFNDFCLQFVDGCKNIIGHYFPQYKNSLFLQDNSYLKKVISSSISRSLNQSETEVLYWAANGKSSYEISLILDRQQSTIEEQKKSIRRKLDVSNMAQAVFEGIKLGYIGAFSQGWGLKESTIPHSLHPISNVAKNTNIELINTVLSN